jgi:chromosome partitioning protein
MPTTIIHHAEAHKVRLAHLIAKLREAHGLVIVDTAGFENLGSSVATASANAVLIPCTSSEADLYEARTTSAKVQSLAVTTRKAIPAYVVMNGIRATNVSAYTTVQIVEAGLVQLKTALGRRADFEAMSLSGRAPWSGEACREATALMKELCTLDAIQTSRNAVKA